jgi:hypothetical protein
VEVRGHLRAYDRNHNFIVEDSRVSLHVRSRVNPVLSGGRAVVFSKKKFDEYICNCVYFKKIKIMFILSLEKKIKFCSPKSKSESAPVYAVWV